MRMIRNQRHNGIEGRLTDTSYEFTVRLRPEEVATLWEENQRLKAEVRHLKSKAQEEVDWFYGHLDEMEERYTRVVAHLREQSAPPDQQLAPSVSTSRPPAPDSPRLSPDGAGGPNDRKDVAEIV